MENERSTLLRRGILFGVPVLYLVLGLLHPANPELGDETGLFVNLHIAQLFLIWGLAYLLWLLVEGLDSPAARVSRALILPFVIAYTALDAVLGIAWGIVVEKANELPVADQPAAGRLIDDLINGEPEARGLILYWGAGLLWLAVALSAVVAIREKAPRPALVLMAMGAVVFALGHARPMGPIGMALFLAGLAWFELRPRPADATRAVSVQGA